jgi:N6-L-threonylcarbamoyladenine synthase
VGPVLAIETSCDETAAALIGADGQVIAAEVASQIALHRPYGGVVPEVASRNHLTQLEPVVAAVLQQSSSTIGDVAAFAATIGPGLATSLMIGVAMAKGLAIANRRPFLAINHIEGHLLSPFMGDPRGIRRSMALVVSGGHTLLVEVESFRNYHLLGSTRDDAAGEAFDKVGKLLGLPYPGGPHIEKNAMGGNPAAFDFPRSMLHSPDYDFSFSGLKTAVRYLLPTVAPDATADLCASFQQAIVDVLVGKTMRAAQERRHQTIAISGGVTCNRRLREKFSEATATAGMELLVAPAPLCTDNASMIGFVAHHAARTGTVSPLDTDVSPNLRLSAA